MTDRSISPSLQEFAQNLVLKDPNVFILRADLRKQYPSVTQSLESSFIGKKIRKNLLLPDLSAYGNKGVGIFSDYGGESTGKFNSYSFLVCAMDGIGFFEERMKEVRNDFGLGQKEYSYKDLRNDRMRRSVPEYLCALDGGVNGLLCNVLVEKKIPTLFGRHRKTAQKRIVTELNECGFGIWKSKPAEKLATVVHIAAYLTGLLADEGQNVFWMSDHDDICPNPEKHAYALNLFNTVVRSYKREGFQFGRIGGATPFKERSVLMLDLLSAADLAAGSVEQYFSLKEELGNVDFGVKGGSDDVLRWFAHDGVGLKKATIVIRQSSEGFVTDNTVEFRLLDPPKKAPLVVPLRV
ncbi:hypothetical protein [Jiella pacifica]|uniref:DUF3800 domain-containing protein n=1 Tax=Jiella pacifica TaxID=2696469 RepID=A0A6N9T0W2_9HYPH|nr:hypothetical protein [Jiella pacifica]NDW05003.1 hypothetical protein [Jiella pacifica]